MTPKNRPTSTIATRAAGPKPRGVRRAEGASTRRPYDTVAEWPAPRMRCPHPDREPGGPVARVVVDVMLKPEILDPQGKAVHGALPRLGFDGVTDVRQGKRFELELDGDITPERLAQVNRAAETLLSNPVIETYTVRVEEQ